MPKFRVKLLLSNGNEATEEVEAESPSMAEKAAIRAAAAKGMKALRALRTKQVKGEVQHENINNRDLDGERFSGSSLHRNHWRPSHQFK